MFFLISLLHHIQSFANFVKGRDRYPYLAYCSSTSIASTNPLGHSHWWYARVSDLLVSIGITIDRLPPFRYSFAVPGHLLPTKQEMNRIKDDIYKQLVRVTWINPQGELHSKMVFYAHCWALCGFEERTHCSTPLKTSPLDALTLHPPRPVQSGLS